MTLEHIHIHVIIIIATLLLKSCYQTKDIIAYSYYLQIRCIFCFLSFYFLDIELVRFDIVGKDYFVSTLCKCTQFCFLKGMDSITCASCICGIVYYYDIFVFLIRFFVSVVVFILVTFTLFFFTLFVFVVVAAFIVTRIIIIIIIIIVVVIIVFITILIMLITTVIIIVIVIIVITVVILTKI